MPALQRPPLITFKSLGLLFGFLLAVVINVLTDVKSDPAVFWLGLVFTGLLVLFFDYLSRYADYGIGLAEWQNTQLKDPINQLKDRYAPLEDELRGWLVALDMAIQDSPPDPLHYVLYVLGSDQDKKYWVPIGNYRDHLKSQFAIPYDDLWFRQAYFENRTRIMEAQSEPLDRFNDMAQREVFSYIKMIAVTPVRNLRNDEIIGMITIYALEPNSDLEAPAIRTRMEETSVSVATILMSYNANSEVTTS
jgi:hypothetical protein